MRYMAVERLDLTGSPASKESDVYSLAMTAFTVLTGITPYIDVNGYITLIVRIKSGDRPSRPTNLAGSRLMPDDVWDMITSCWNDVPGLRSDISSMYEVFLASSLQEVHRVKTDIRTGERKRSSKKIRSRLADFFQSLLVSEPEIKRLVNDMDQRLENQTMSDKERRRLFNELCKTCSRRRVIPDSMYIPDRSNEATVEYTGGFATVSRSAYGGHQVAIKVINVYTNTLNTTRSGFCREVVAWKHLRHPNILPLLGVTFDDDYFSMVSEWMDNGNINEFILKDPDANRTALLADVANGLKYMHDLSIVHGDIKGANILINKDRRGCIADFSLTTITGVGSHPAHGVTPIATTFSGDTLMSFTAGGTYRWMSPELLDPDQFGIPKEEEGRPTRQSDCYALGMVIYEVLCGHSPFIEKENSLMLTSEIVNGVRPTKPEGAERLGFNNELWTIVERCWQGIIVERPGIDDILSCLNDATAFWYMREL
ncbi:kinase-like domain-containing protein [Thelephora terrestris]|uniref:Kinase-like domain-containing protein n=1 Tax=Thelephora terrestris TaxID=56493 RepID=A0A9P6LAK2_9AGAM|nr:kinase-like domain-containing protein [Thelephora terrestris]